MTESPRSIGVQLLAAFFVLLVGTPVTEPFSVCAPSALVDTPAVHAAVVPAAAATATPVRRDGGYPPLSLTDDQLKDSKDMVAAPQVLVTEPPSSASHPVLASDPGAGAVRPAPLILRL